MGAVLDENVINDLLANWPLHDSTLLGFAHTGALANTLDATRGVTGIDLADPKTDATSGLSRVAHLLEASDIARPHCSPPLKPAGLVLLGQMTLLSGLLASVRRTLGVNLLGANAASLLTEKLRKLSTSGFSQMVQSGPKINPAGLARLVQLGAAAATLHSARMNPAGGKGAGDLGLFLSRLRANGLLGALERLPFRAATLARLTTLASFSVGVQSLRSGFGVFRGGMGPGSSLIADPLKSGPLGSMLHGITTGSLGPGFALPNQGQVAPFGVLLSGVRAVRSGTGMNLFDATVKEKLFKFLESLERGEAGRAVKAEPLSAAQLGGVARFHSVTSDIQSVRTGLGVDLLHKDAPSQLGRAVGDFQRHGEVPAENCATVGSEVLESLSKLSKLGNAFDEATKLGLLSPAR